MIVSGETNYTLSGMQIRARFKLLQKIGKKRAWEMFEHKVVCQTEYVAIRLACEQALELGVWVFVGGRGWGRELARRLL